MKKIETKNITATHSDALSEEDVKARRDFMKKYGALAAITPVALSTVLHSQSALANSGACTFGCDEGAP